MSQDNKVIKKLHYAAYMAAQEILCFGISVKEATKALNKMGARMHRINKERRIDNAQKTTRNDVERCSAS
ncbi:MAG: hypothetical protein KAV87_09660 [Desulfobacteraceae bacterium]|nr:hypothetical protein [Desulfobacteraceae bacterium]